MGTFQARWLGGEEHTGTFDDVAAEHVMAAYASRGHDLAIDYNHRSIDLDADEHAARAAGSFDLELRTDGLWAVNVQWTDTAAQYIQAREYRYISPVWDEDEDGRVMEVHNIALTANPAMLGYAPLVATTPVATTSTQPDKGDSMKSVITALKMDEGANEQAVATRAAKLVGLEQAVLGLTGATNLEQAQGTLNAWQQASTQLATVTEQLETSQAQLVKQERDTLIADALKANKLSPALKDWAEAAPLETLKSFLASAPTLIPTETKDGATVATGSVAGKAWDDMTPMERHNLYVSDQDSYQALRAGAVKGGN